MTLVPKSTKSYSIFLGITIDTLNKSLERQRNINSLWLTADTNIWLLFFLVATWIFEEFPGNLFYVRVLFSCCSRNAWNFCLSSAIIWNKVNSAKFEKAKNYEVAAWCDHSCFKWTIWHWVPGYNGLNDSMSA